MAKNIARKVEQLPAAPRTPMEILMEAISQGATPEVLKGLLELQERWEDRLAYKAFNAAIAKAKADLPSIHKRRLVEYPSKQQGRDKTSYRYESFNDIAEVVAPALSQNGLHYRFRTEVLGDGRIMVTCILSHDDGHTEENSLSAAPDPSGSKNHVQAVGSTQTYLQRYTLKAALGIAAGEDNDGNAAPDPELDKPISEEQVAKIKGLLVSTNTPEQKYLTWAKVEKVEDITERFYASCLSVLEEKKARPK